jgi:hypothetical protein
MLPKNPKGLDGSIKSLKLTPNVDAGYSMNIGIINTKVAVQLNFSRWAAIAMRTSKVILLVVGAAIICGCAQKAPSRPIASKLPLQIQEAKELLKGKPRNQIRQIMIEQFGPAQRVAHVRGTSVPIDQWDIAGGELAFNPVVGPTFTPKGQERIWLHTTHNPVRKNLLGSYEMVSLAAADPDAQRCWLGNLQIEPDLSYAYKDSGKFPEKSARQTNNFFYLHPAGTVEIRYAAGVTDEALLEALATESLVAWLRFRSGDARQTFTISTKAPDRHLVFGASPPLSFDMDKRWESDWE